MRRLNVRILALVILILGLVVTGSIFMQKALYTNSLSTRPFNLGLSEPVEKLEPSSVQNHSQRLVASAIYEGLVYYDESRQSIEPRLARKWEYSPDGKSVTIQLRKDVKFSNGKNLTAQDVKASFEYNIATSADWSNTCLYLPIEGSKEKINGKAMEILGVKVLDKHSLKITFVQPDAAFMASLSNPIFWILDLESGLKPPSGTGPYMLKEMSSSSLQLLPNDYYYCGKPHLSAMNVIIYPDEDTAFKAYKEGKLDLLDAIPFSEMDNVRKSKDYKGLLIEKPVLEIYCLGFNMSRDPYAHSYLLRRALNYAIDRDRIIKQILGSGYLPAKGLVPTGLESYNKDITGYHYDAEKARQLLAEAGYPEGRGLPVLTLTYNDDPGHALVAEEVARQLGEFGIRVQTLQQGWDYYKKQINSRAISFFRLSWAADYPDADNYLYSLFHSSQIGMTNFCGYQNPQVDKILDSSRKQYEDPQARLKLLRRAESIIIDDAPCLWLFQKKAQKLVSKDVRNLNFDRMEMIDWYKVELLKPTIEKANENKSAQNNTKAVKKL
jgi:peptide/nickel transport system substrate-binding protein/oligopeptide transport system substrate-binding protein